MGVNLLVGRTASRYTFYCTFHDSDYMPHVTAISHALPENNRKSGSTQGEHGDYSEGISELAY